MLTLIVRFALPFSLRYPALWSRLLRLATAVANSSPSRQIRQRLFPGGTYVLASLGAYEPSTLRAFAAYCRPGSVVVDVGANIGQYTQFASRLVGAQGTVIAFEPVASTAALLDASMKRLGLTNVVIEHTALSDSVGTAEFIFAKEGDKLACLADGGHYLSDDAEAPVLRETVSTTTLDEYVRQRGLRRVDVVKIDVQGAELKVLRGMNEVLSQWRPAVIVELTGDRSIQEGQWFLQERGYRCRIVEEMAVQSQDPLRYVNLLAEPI